MRWRQAAMVVFLLLPSACQTEREPGLHVRVALEAGLRSSHAQVTVAAGGERRSTGCMPLAGQTSLDVAVAQAGLPFVVQVTALGFTDAQCGAPTAPEEAAAPVEGLFRAGRIADVSLTLRRTTPGLETACANGLDDDLDGAADCLDVDCTDRECTRGNLCVTGMRCQGGVCLGGSALACPAPPSACLRGPGTCEEDAGCRYAPAPDAGCDDADRCTEDDRCTDDAACHGRPVRCDAPPAPQCWQPEGTCRPDAGCTYEATPDAGCDDGAACTVDDRCDALGGCGGTPRACPDTECQVFTGACTNAGCAYAPRDAGTPCTGGACNHGGGCIPTFAFVPSNVAPLDVPTPPDGGVTLDCGETVIDTGATGAPSVTNWCAGQPMFGAAGVMQSNGVPAMVLSFGELTVGAGATLRVVGVRPAIIVSTGTIEVLGTVRAEAGAQGCAGAGAGAAGGGILLNYAGGGGGGFGSSGGEGATGALGEPGGQGGSPLPDTGLVPLRGGCPGGLGGGSDARVAPGGGGLQLVAAQDLVVAGVITAPGFGGGGGGLTGAGNGGGSGGALLLEARRVIASAGAITANGGGGGEAGTSNAGAPGAEASDQPAPGGRDALPGARGGDGAAGTTTAESGQYAGGGGGGGVGRIRLNVRDGCSLGPTVTISPAASSNRPDAGCP